MAIVIPESYKTFIKSAPPFSVLYAKREDPATLGALSDHYKAAQIQLRELLGNPTTTHDRANYTLIGHGETDWNAQQKNAGLLGPMLNESGECKALVFSRSDDGQLIFCSDVPRALHHGLLIYKPSLEGELRAIATHINNETGVIEQDAWKSLVDMAFSAGIIVTPLVRPPYVGRVEGLKKDLSNAEGEAQLDAACKRMQDYKQRAASGEPISSSFLDHMLGCGFAFFENLADEQGIYMPSADIVTHSSFFDIADIYARYLDSFGKNMTGEVSSLRGKSRAGEGRISLIALKKEQRDPEVTTKTHNHYSCYLTNCAPLDRIVKRSAKTVAEFRELSHDKIIRSGDGIIPAEFYTLEPEKGQDKKTAVALNVVKTCEQPVLLLGPCGIGKTTCAQFQTQEYLSEYEQGCRYVPVLVRLRYLPPRYVGKPRKLGRKLSGGATRLSIEAIEALRRSPEAHELVFILEGYDELQPAFKARQEPKNPNCIEEIIRKYLLPRGKVILTSRPEHFSPYKDGNPGYLTVHLDEEAIVRNLDAYLARRIGDPEERKRFGQFLQQQNDDMKKNWLIVALLTALYKHKPEIIEAGKMPMYQLMDEGIQEHAWTHAVERDPDLAGRAEAKASKRTRTYLKKREEELRRAFLDIVMPQARNTAARMTTMDTPILTDEEAEECVDNSWNIIVELERRKAVERTKPTNT